MLHTMCKKESKHLFTNTKLTVKVLGWCFYRFLKKKLIPFYDKRLLQGNHGNIIKCLYWKKKKKKNKAYENPRSSGIVYILAMVNWNRPGYLCDYTFNDECHTNHFDF